MSISSVRYCKGGNLVENENKSVDSFKGIFQYISVWESIKMYLTIWFLLAITIIGVILIIQYLIKFNRRKQKISKYVQHLPAPKEYPVIGSALRFFGKSSEGE